MLIGPIGFNGCKARRFLGLSFGSVSLLRKENRIDAGDDSAASDGDVLQQPVQLLVVPNSHLNMPRSKEFLLVVPCSVARQLQNLRRQVLKNRREEEPSG